MKKTLKNGNFSNLNILLAKKLILKQKFPQLTHHLTKLFNDIFNRINKRTNPFPLKKFYSFF